VAPLANQHVRRELDDLARRLDHRADAVDLAKEAIGRPEITVWNWPF
jgi:hypothetical protein